MSEQPLMSPTAVNPRVSIIIITCNQLSYTQQCLESIRRNTSLPYELIVVDNGSQDGTVPYLQSQPDLFSICNMENRGFPEAANEGLRAAKAPFLLLLNNDIVVPQGWLERLIRPLLDHPDLGLVGPTTNCISGPQEIPITYPDLSGLDGFAADLAQRCAGQLEYVDRLVGFCLLIRREVIDRIGLFDERFGIGNFEDDDFCRRAAAAGFRAAIARDAFIHHFGSITFRARGIDVDSLLRRNARLYEEKWPPAPLSPSTASRDIVPPIPELPDIPRLSLCMIVRDAARTLPACLESIRPWVDEMVVVDTGSTDDTIAIARSFGAKVFTFPWPDSFAAARNESLRHATGDWLFWMDADDTIDPDNGRKLRDLARKKTRNLAYILQVRCPPHTPASPTGTAPTHASDTLVDHVKLFRNHPSIRFTGRIHEQILPAIRRLAAASHLSGTAGTDPAQGGVEWTDIVITHSGSDQSPAGRTRKHQRDLRLLELELADDPDSTFTLFNLGMTLLDAGRPGEALNALARSLQLASPAESHTRKIYALLVQAYCDLSRPATAFKTCLQGLACFPQDVELLFRKGQLEYLLGRHIDAEQTLRSLLDRPADSAPRYFSSFDHGILGIRAWHTLALIYDKLSRHDRAVEAWHKVLSCNRQNLAAWRGLIDSLTQAQDHAALNRLAQNPESDTPPDAAILARARAFSTQGNTPEAIAILERALAPSSLASAHSNASTMSTPIDLLDELCRLFFASDQLPTAERWLTELSRLRPDDPAAHLNLAVILLRRQNYSQAVHHARRSLQLRPNHPIAQDVLVKATANLRS